MSLFLVFTKEFRKLESLMSELRKKIKESKEFKEETKANTSIYRLDKIDLFFDAVKHTFKVQDKSGEKIISIDWHSDHGDEMQQARYNQVHNLLMFVYKIEEERAKKAEQMKASTKKMKDAKKVLSDAAAAKAKREKNIEIAMEALKRMKGL